MINYFPAIATIILAHIIPTTDKRKLAMTQCIFLLLYFSLLNTRKSFILKNNTLGIFHHGMILKYDSSIFPPSNFIFFLLLFFERNHFSSLCLDTADPEVHQKFQCVLRIVDNSHSFASEFPFGQFALSPTGNCHSRAVRHIHRKMPLFRVHGEILN